MAVLTPNADARVHEHMLLMGPYSSFSQAKFIFVVSLIINEQSAVVSLKWQHMSRHCKFTSM